jgi:hypothetical protein
MNTLPGVDYADAYAVGLPPGVSPRTFAEAVFASSPRWVAGLMALRNTIVRGLGLIATRSALEHAAAANGSGARIGIFPVLAEGETRSCSASMTGTSTSASPFACSTTGASGSAWSPRSSGSTASSAARTSSRRAAHQLIVPAMLRRAGRRRVETR